ncbi:Outer surface protein, partial [human gut metagenome]
SSDLISVGDKDTDNVIDEFKIMLNAAKQEGMEVIADIDPAIFKKL